ncbi:hypothetical protein C8Q72DRAFT_180502 [Fomitopsis betulina]|nr:hypothetical protein C8Q72DRAFT_180502 [Fomitopsis betulina]
MTGSNHVALLENQDELYAIDTEINALAPISLPGLPPEILSKIFLHIAGRGSADPACWHPQAVGRWIRVTHVCTYWREVALQCAALWSHLHLTDLPEILHEFLARSKDAPLSITSDPRAMDTFKITGRESYEDNFLLALSALHRVRMILVVMSENYDPTNAVFERLGGCAPLIQSLELRSASDHSNHARLRSAISRMLSQPETRSLRSLNTEFCCVDWTNTPFHGLIRLDICGDRRPSGTSMESFLKALDRMYCLEDLVLSNVFSYRFQTRLWALPNALHSSITLPRLRYLEIRGEHQLFTSMFLNSLHMPSLRRLDLVVLQSKIEDDSVELFAAVSQKATALGPFLTSLYEEHTTGTSFCAYRDVLQRTTDPKDDSTSVWREQHAPALGILVCGRKQNYLTELITSLPLGRTRTLILDGEFPSQDDWLSLTRCLETVTELRLYRATYHEHRMGKMLSLKHGEFGGGHALFVLPNLEAVIMDELIFSPEECPLGLELAASFARRAGEGPEIKTLRILRSRILREDDRKRLCEAVPFAETDGHGPNRERRWLSKG